MRAAFVGIVAGMIALATSCQCGDPAPGWSCESGADASVILGSTSWRFWFPWTTTPTGFAHVQEGAGGGEVAFVDRSFARVAGPYPVPPGSGENLLWPFDESVLVASSIRDADAGVDQLFLARLFPDGGAGFELSDGGSLLEIQREHTSGGIHAIASNDRSCILVVWDDGCSGWLWKGMTIAPNGNPRSAPMGFRSTGARACLVDGPRNFVAFGSSGFAYGEEGPNSTDANRTVLVRLFDCSMNEDVAAAREYSLGVIPPGTWFVLRNLRSMAEPTDQLWALIAPLSGNVGAFGVADLRGGGTQVLSVDAGSSNSVYAVALVRSSAGQPVTVWSELTADGRTEFFAQRIGRENKVLLRTSPTWTISPFPSALAMGDGMIAVGGLVPSGDGGYLQLAERYCEPP